MKSNTDEKGDLKTLSLPELKKKLGFAPDGLSQAEAAKRLAQYGPNEIKEKKTNLFLKFLSYFWGPIPWMIEVSLDSCMGFLMWVSDYILWRGFITNLWLMNEGA